MENSKANATRQRERVNEGAKQPTFQVGDKVLLYNPVTKKHDSAKLTIRYTGPYLVTSADEHYNYRLQDLTTGKSLKRPVHCSRLRPLNELDNDYRLKQPDTQSALYECQTHNRPLTLSTVVGTH